MAGKLLDNIISKLRQDPKVEEVGPNDPVKTNTWKKVKNSDGGTDVIVGNPKKKNEGHGVRVVFDDDGNYVTSDTF